MIEIPEILHRQAFRVIKMHKPGIGEQLSRLVNEFHGRIAPETMRTAGYSALIDHYHLKAPLPSKLACIAERHHKVETIEWELLTPRHAPPMIWAVT